jgi:hypothetical protein
MDDRRTQLFSRFDKAEQRLLRRSFAGTTYTDGDMREIIAARNP